MNINLNDWLNTPSVKNVSQLEKTFNDYSYILDKTKPQRVVFKTNTLIDLPWIRYDEFAGKSFVNFLRHTAPKGSIFIDKHDTLNGRDFLAKSKKENNPVVFFPRYYKSDIGTYHRNLIKIYSSIYMYDLRASFDDFFEWFDSLHVIGPSNIRI